jgi:hypothetical protein
MGGEVNGGDREIYQHYIKWDCALAPSAITPLRHLAGGCAYLRAFGGGIGND